MAAVNNEFIERLTEGKERLGVVAGEGMWPREAVF